MNRTGKKKKRKNQNATPLLLLVFITVALVTIVILEYIDFRKGEKSFIFTKIFPLKKTTAKVTQFNSRLTEILNKNKIPYDYFLDDENKFHFKLDIDQERFDGLIEKIKNVTDKLKGTLELTEIQGLAKKSIMLYEIQLDGKVTHLLLITKLRPAEIPQKATPSEEKKFNKVQEKPIEKPYIPSNKKPRIAFIIDDIGEYDIGPLELKQLKIPITASVLPDSRYASEVVHWLDEYGLKAMIHLPMQPTNSRGKHYDTRKVITLNSTDQEIRTLIRRAKRVIPIAKGMNNHEGSLVTSNRSVMTRILKIVKEEGLFFVDSRTIGGTVAYEIALDFGIKTAFKDFFLDHTQTYSHSMTQIRKLVDIALQKGVGIAIGHPFKTTLKAIRDSKNYIKSKGVTIVYVSELLH